MNQKLKWGIISTANIGREVVIPAINKSDDSEVIAIASRNEQVDAIAEELNIPNVFKSYEEMLDWKEIDCVYIPLPNSLHVEWVKKAAQKGKHVLCEKPASLSIAEFEEMVETCKTNGVIFMEAFMYQFHPQHQRVKEILSMGEIGELKEIQATFSFELDKAVGQNIRLNKDLGGGALYDIGCYCIHAITTYIDQLPSKVDATATIDEVFNVDITVNGKLEYENNLKASFECSFEKPFKHEYKIIGTKGSILVSKAFRPDVYKNEGIITLTKIGEPSIVETVYGDQYVLQVDYFAGSVKSLSRSNELTQRSIRNVAILEACMNSILSGRMVKQSEQRRNV